MYRRYFRVVSTDIDFGTVRSFRSSILNLTKNKVFSTCGAHAVSLLPWISGKAYHMHFLKVCAQVKFLIYLLHFFVILLHASGKYYNFYCPAFV